MTEDDASVETSSTASAETTSTDEAIWHSDEVILVGAGLCMAWFCAPKSMPMEEVQRLVTLHHPSGTSAGWILEEDPDNPEPRLVSPGRCDMPGDRHHWRAIC